MLLFWAQYVEHKIAFWCWAACCLVVSHLKGAGVEVVVWTAAEMQRMVWDVIYKQERVQMDVRNKIITVRSFGQKVAQKNASLVLYDIEVHQQLKTGKETL